MRSVRRLVTVAGVAAALGALAAAPAQAQFVYAQNVVVVNQGVSRCLDRAGGSWNNGTQILVWDCHGATNQLWWLSQDGKIMTQMKCVDATSDGRIVLWDCHGGANQKWTVYGGRLRSQMYGKCLTASGNNLSLAPCDSRMAQMWGAGRRYPLWQIRDGRLTYGGQVSTRLLPDYTGRQVVSGAIAAGGGNAIAAGGGNVIAAGGGNAIAAGGGNAIAAGGYN
jgi:hypothetical protein